METNIETKPEITVCHRDVLAATDIPQGEALVEYGVQVAINEGTAQATAFEVFRAVLHESPEVIAALYTGIRTNEKMKDANGKQRIVSSYVLSGYAHKIQGTPLQGAVVKAINRGDIRGVVDMKTVMSILTTKQILGEGIKAIPLDNAAFHNEDALADLIAYGKEHGYNEPKNGVTPFAIAREHDDDKRAALLVKARTAPPMPAPQTTTPPAVLEQIANLPAPDEETTPEETPEETTPAPEETTTPAPEEITQATGETLSAPAGTNAGEDPTSEEETTHLPNNPRRETSRRAVDDDLAAKSRHDSIVDFLRGAGWEGRIPKELYSALEGLQTAIVIDSTGDTDNDPCRARALMVAQKAETAAQKERARLDIASAKAAERKAAK